MRVLIFKAKRLLQVLDGGRLVLQAKLALGPCATGAKTREGDGKTPEGEYHICLVKEAGKYGKSLGLDYPGVGDAELALAQGGIDAQAYNAILTAHREGRRPPWGTPLGGEIYLHAGGARSDWTQGCIALEDEDMERLFDLHGQVEVVEILPE